VTVAIRRLWDDLRTTIAQVMLSIILLVYHAGEMVRAIVVTLVRVLVTQRRLLEWETAASVAARAAGLNGRDGLKIFELEMASSPLVALGLLAALGRFAPAARSTALPFVVAWLLAPLVAYWLSRPVAIARIEFTTDERRHLRAWARRT
jgi:cyclic beta-1,2-glucan synthetase